MLSIINPHTLQPFPSAAVGGRVCFAIPYEQPFAVRVVVEPPGTRHEAVISVDGRNVLDNTPAYPGAPGVVFCDSYICKGFQVSSGSVREFVHMPAGRDLLTAERAGAGANIGVIGLAVYSDGSRRYRRGEVDPYSFGGATRSAGPTRGGTMAGAEVSAPLGETEWTRGHGPVIEVVEYDTHEGWAARGVMIPRVGDANPWPAQVRYAQSSAL